MIITIPQLNKGELYAGILTDETGTPKTHVILLPSESESLSWLDAKEWADEAGGELPTRQELALLFVNLCDQFQLYGYWSGESYSANSAWYQYFDSASKYYGHKDGLRWARAVRRVAI